MPALIRLLAFLPNSHVHAYCLPADSSMIGWFPVIHLPRHTASLFALEWLALIVSQASHPYIKSRADPEIVRADTTIVSDYELAQWLRIDLAALRAVSTRRIRPQRVAGAFTRQLDAIGVVQVARIDLAVVPDRLDDGLTHVLIKT